MTLRPLLLVGGLALGYLAGASPASATSVAPRPLQALVAEAEEIVVAKVLEVEMVDGAGRPVTGVKALTGPGLDNQIHLVLQVNEVMRPENGGLPGTLRVPLWSMWHDSLAAARDREMGREWIFLLKRDRHQPVYPIDFQWPLQERGRIQALMASP
ncbi:hypothetical protein D3C81_1212220 [compost metagenome]